MYRKVYRNNMYTLSLYYLFLSLTYLISYFYTYLLSYFLLLPLFYVYFITTYFITTLSLLHILSLITLGGARPTARVKRVRAPRVMMTRG